MAEFVVNVVLVLALLVLLLGWAVSASRRRRTDRRERTAEHHLILAAVTGPGAPIASMESSKDEEPTPIHAPRGDTQPNTAATPPRCRHSMPR